MTTYDLCESQPRLYSLCELGHRLGEDLLLECTITIQVDISIERSHQPVRDEDGHTNVQLGDGYLVSLGLPAEHTIGASHEQAFADGETQLVCDLRYAEEEKSSLNIDDVIRALGLRTDERIWRVKTAP